MAVKYDPSVIQEMADQLYARARTMVAQSVLLGLLFGSATGAVVALFLGELRSEIGVGLVVTFAALCAVLGASSARTKTLSLRLQAQELLCQVQIEMNTRRAAS
ncbi:MAG: hypothetical protein KC668_21175 [Myxococcales bacterium]|nr:hypothetical protein [Myxococcales bacterium]